MSDLRYPIGKFQPGAQLDAAARDDAIDAIARLPGQLAGEVRGLNDEQLDTPYRPGGWTVRQLVHHLADSHLNAYQRFKLTLTEDHPTIRTYDQDLWAQQMDARTAPTACSLELLTGLHDRWVRFMRTMSPEGWRRTLRHPEIGDLTLDDMLSLYAWHGRHHVAHITELKASRGWLSV